MATHPDWAPAKDEVDPDMKSVFIAFAAILVAAAVASAAELPTMKPRRTEHYKTCNVGGMSGFLIPGSDTCVKLGGYVSGGIEAGNAKTQYNWTAGSHD
jgi:hypothetical protein